MRARVELVPDRDHCIETVARAEYRRCVSRCLGAPGEPDPGLAWRLEVLRRFLEEAPFPRLRAQTDRALRAGLPVRFEVWLAGDRVAYRMVTGAPEGLSRTRSRT